MYSSNDQSGSSGIAEQVRHIRANAQLVVRMFAGETDFEFGLNEQSVRWLDAYIDRVRTTAWSDAELDQLVANLGSYLGEAIIAAFGGEWALDRRGWHVCFDEQNRAYPFAKVSKQFKNGPEDSIYSFYSVTGILRRK
jgi:hypothetical protein